MGGAATATQLPGVLHTLEPTLNRFGYLAVAGLVFAEDFGAPVPGETVLILGAIYAGAGRLNILLVALVGFCGAVLGDNVGFAIGRLGGRQLLERYGRYIFLTAKRIDRAAAYFETHGGRIISVARFIWGLRQANGLIAGAIGMSWTRFVLFNTIGAAMWVTVWTVVGYLSGSHINSIYYAATHVAKYLALAVAVSLLGYLGHRLIRHRRADMRGAR
jgi:membrane protein DedA with SNARE-associated domain